jgi:DivIVA domain-containing protein
MRLTPADVHNVAFKKPSIGKRGYDEDEVDAFLDLVEAELASLIEENNELTQRLSTYEAGGTPPTADTQPLHEEISRLQQENEQLAQRAEAAEQSAGQAQADSEQAGQARAGGQQDVDTAQPVAADAAVAASVGEANHVQAARLLGLAQETADRLTAEAAEEAEKVRSSARADAESQLANAKSESDRMLSEAKNNSESQVSEAQAAAEAAERDARIKAEAMDREAQRKYTETMTQLTEHRSTLEKKIDDLRTYEREYRSRLKSWISDQLRQLDDSSANGGSENGDAQQVEQQPEAAQKG